MGMRNRAAVTALMGDLRRARGDLSGTAAAYDEAEALRVRLLELDGLEHPVRDLRAHRRCSARQGRGPP